MDHRVLNGFKRVFGATKEPASPRIRAARDLDGSNAAPERTQTDQGLRKERSRTDQALAERQAAINEEADLVIDRARKNADAIVVAARDMADDALDPATTPAGQRAATTEQRQLEDASVHGERAAADQTLVRERKEAARVLAGLLPLERQATDRYLLTERKRSDGALARRKGLLGIVAHDLRDLLGGVVLSAEILSKYAAGTASPEPILAETARLTRYAARMNRLVGDLVDTASIDAGKLAIKPVPGDVAMLLAEAADTFRAAAGAKGLSLEIEAVEPSLTAAFDHGRLLQVLANCISNSIKFTPQGGRVTLRCQRSGSELRFCVSDTGPGIPAESLEAIFERFWQVGKNARTGLGLGLYLSRCLVEAHGGRTWAESTPGNGAKIFFTLPAWQQDERRRARAGR
jgi:signal transduction histidine kinase